MNTCHHPRQRQASVDRPAGGPPRPAAVERLEPRILLAAVPQDVAFFETFDGPALPVEADGWEFSSSHINGQTRIVSGRLRMDVGRDDALNLNEAILHLNLAGRSNLELRFEQAEFGDEPHAMDESFTGSRNGDGVSISDDGLTWYAVVGAGELNVNDTMTPFVVDLDQAVADVKARHDGTFGYSADFRIKFQQYDNFPYDMDGREWDNIVVYDWSASPAQPDLDPGSDYGAASDDNLTRNDNSSPPQDLEFDVPGTVPGAAVTLYADGVEIGDAVAAGLNTKIVTNGTVDLADGDHAITARQEPPGHAQTPDGPALTVTIDTVAPTADLAVPADGDTVLWTSINPDGNYIDVTFTDAVGLDEASITDAGNEFDLFGDAVAGVTVDGSAVLLSGTTYRYSFTDTFGLGPVEVSFWGGGFDDLAGNGCTGETESFTVVAAMPQVLPYYQPFDGPLPEPVDGWAISFSRPRGRIEVVSGRLRMDCTDIYEPSVNAIVLHLDLAGLSNVALTFDQAEFRDEPHELPPIFMWDTWGDGVAVSDGRDPGHIGPTWYTIVNAADLDTGPGLTPFAVDLDRAVADIRALPGHVPPIGQLGLRSGRARVGQRRRLPAPDGGPVPSDGRRGDRPDDVQPGPAHYRRDVHRA